MDAETPTSDAATKPADIEKGLTFPIKRKKTSTKKHPGFVKNMGNYVTEYTENTSLHGVRYLGEKNRNIFERLWWLIVFIISLYICVDLIIKTYRKWETSPVIVSFAQSPTPIWQIPFPSLTICPATKSRQNVFNFTRMYHKHRKENISDDDLANLRKVGLICDSHLVDHGFDTTNYSTIDFLQSVAPRFDETFDNCKWANEEKNCSSLFTPILTEDGVCYTFNMLDRDDIYKDNVFDHKEFLNHGQDRHGWTLDFGYSKDVGLDTFPKRALSAGQSAGLSFYLRDYDKQLDYLCKGPVQGFKVLLHHPGEVPRILTQYFRAPLNQEIIVTVKPDMMTTSENLRDYYPSRRKCYFGTERELAFYRNYTQQNCEAECFTNYTLSVCGCVLLGMTHEEGTPLCGTGMTKCVSGARRELLISQVTSGIGGISFNKTNITESMCNCLPACTSLTYNAEMSQADFNWPAMLQAYKKNMSESPGVKMTHLTIFFKEMQFITSTRNELYGLTDFLASCGGLLGLFIGFSFLSAVETLYFLTFRLWCNIRRHGRHYWSGSPNLINNDKYDYTK